MSNTAQRTPSEIAIELTEWADRLNYEHGPKTYNAALLREAAAALRKPQQVTPEMMAAAIRAYITFGKVYDGAPEAALWGAIEAAITAALSAQRGGSE